MPIPPLSAQERDTLEQRYGDLTQLKHLYLWHFNDYTWDDLHWIAHCTNLEILAVHCTPPTQTTQRLYLPSTLKELSISKLYGTEVPSIIRQLPQLEKLDLIHCNFEQFGDLSDMTKLHSLGYYSYELDSQEQSDHQVPPLETLSSCPNLNHLELSHRDWSSLSALSKLPKLTSLSLREMPAIDADTQVSLPSQLKKIDLSRLQAKVLPEFIRQLSALESISLYQSPLNELGDLSAIHHLKAVHIHQETPPAQQLPLPNLDALIPHQQLEQVKLRGNFAKDAMPIALALLPAQTEIDLELDENARRSNDLMKQLKVLRQSKLSDDEKIRYFHTLFTMNFPRELPEMDGRFYLTYLEGKYTPFKEKSLAWLRQTSAQHIAQHPLITGSVLYLCGKTALKATAFKEKLSGLGISLSKKLTPQVTHILVGQNPKQTEQFAADDPRIIDESALQQAQQQQAPQFLQQAVNDQPEQGQAMVAQVLEMLASPDEASHQVALSLIEQGGITEAMHLPLFFALKTSKNPNIRQSIRMLLGGCGDETFQTAVQDRAFLHELYHKDPGMLEYEGQGGIYKRLKTLEKKWGKPLCQAVALRFWQHQGEGLTYILVDKTDSEIRDQVINSCIETQNDGQVCLNWSRACGFNNGLHWMHADEDTPEDRAQHLMDTHRDPDLFLGHSNYEISSLKTRLPDPTRLSQSIQAINASNCLLSTLPVNFEAYANIEALDLSRNCLSALPAKLSQFSALTHLNLSFNHFETFPAVLLKMPNLKWLDLRRASAPLYRTGYDAPDYQAIEIPETFRQKNPDCIILTDDSEASGSI
ncbi:hypothetical protein VST7929_00219 [Vibrio stylophorae]|uniref:BRCT domain-containing protein n=1 Tax=Vibrio stylophorae TaxID=659351 RepID=A0ABM8ZR63_9VIBR|nr:leucine-rich repeat domain-containing protein [Vibrio stylophorae]CAH0532390.1 hypothetical protein VST7929_00219 [Vibrio stylophorae]